MDEKINFDNLPKTIICDIDGCIFKHMGNLCNMNLEESILLNGVKYGSKSMYNDEYLLFSSEADDDLYFLTISSILFKSL